MARERLGELWIERLSEFRTSGESARAWCQRNGVTLDQLYYWRRKLNKDPQPAPPTVTPGWLPVHLEERAPDNAGPLLVRIGGAAVEVRQGFDPSLLASVVKVLKALC